MATRSPIVAYDAPTSVKINGVDLREFGLELTDYPSILLPPVERRALSLPLMHGEIDLGYRYAPREFTLTFQIRGLDHSDMIAKRDRFLQWIQQPALLQEYIIEGTPIKALRFELAGHGYRYTQGTVSATEGSPHVQGTDTQWLGRITPGCEFRFADLPNEKYIVTAVVDDTHLVLNKPVSADISNGSYWVTRARYLLVNYAGASEASPFAGARGMFKDQLFNFSVSFRASYPFWIGEELILDTTSTGFIDVFNPSNFYVKPILHVKGATPGELILVSGAQCLQASSGHRNNEGLNLIAAGLTDQLTGYIAPYLRFVESESSSKVGLGIFGRPDSTKGDLVKFMSVFRDDGKANPDGVPSSYPTGAADRINYNQGTILIDFTPNWDQSDSKRHVLFNAGYGGSEGRLFIVKAGENDWYVQINKSNRRGGRNIVQAGTTYRAILRFDCDRLLESGYYADLFLGESIDPAHPLLSWDSITEPTKSGGQLNIGFEWYPSAQNSADSIIHRLVIWDIPLDPTDDIAAKLSTPDKDPSTVHPEHIIAGFDFTKETAGNVAVGYQEGDWALEFDGSSQYVKAGNQSSLNFGTSSFAIRVRFRLTSSNANKGLVSKYDSNLGYYFEANGDTGSIGYWLGDGTNVVVGETGSGTISVNSWHDVVYLVDRESELLKIYVDGERVANENISSVGSVDNSYSFMIGRWSGRYFKGGISLSQVFTRALTQSEIQQLTAGLDPQDVLPDYDDVCVLDYRFDGTSGTTGTYPDDVDESKTWFYGTNTSKGYVVDKSGHGNHGELNGYTVNTSNGYPTDGLVRAYVGFKGYCSQRTEVIDSIDGNTVRVGSASGFEVGDLVCVWDKDASNKVITTITDVEFDEASGKWDITLNDTPPSGADFISKNLLANPDFEEGTVYWTDVTNATTSEETSTVKVNSKALKVSNTSTYHGNVTQSISNAESKSYTLRGWVLPNQISYFGAPVIKIGSYPFATAGQMQLVAGQWKFVELTYEGTDPDVTLYVVDNEADDYAIWDTLQLFENKVANPGFEKGGTNGDFNGGAEIDDGVADTFDDWHGSDAELHAVSDRHSGSVACRVVPTGSLPKLVCTSYPTLPGNKWYELTFWAKADTEVTVDIWFNKSGIVDSYYKAGSVTVGTSWSRYSLIFKPSWDTSTDHSLRFYINGSIAVTFDDITLRPIYDVPLEIEAMSKFDHYVDSDKGTGYLIDGSGSILFENVPGRARELTLIVRGQLMSDFASVNLAKWFNNDAPDTQFAALRFSWESSASAWVIEGNVNNTYYSKLKISDGTLFKQPFELAMRLTLHRTCEDDHTGSGTVYVVDLFLNGKRLTTGDTITAFTQNGPFDDVALGYGSTLPSSTFEKLLVGGDSISLAQVAIYEVEAWARGLTDEEIQRGYTEWVTSTGDRTPSTENGVFKITSALEADQELEIDFAGDIVRDAVLKTYDSAHNLISSQSAYNMVDGESLTLKPSIDHERSVIYISDTHGGIRIRFRPHWL